jgi:hypothetical protein
MLQRWNFQQQNIDCLEVMTEGSLRNKKVSAIQFDTLSYSSKNVKCYLQFVIAHKMQSRWEGQVWLHCQLQKPLFVSLNGVHP